MLRAFLFAASMTIALPHAFAGECDPLTIAGNVLAADSHDEDGILGRIAGSRTRAIYASRFFQLWAADASSSDGSLHAPHRDRWLPHFTNTRSLAAGTSVRILKIPPAQGRLYLFYVKRSDGEIRLIYPNKYEGPDFTAPQEGDPAPARTSLQASRSIPGSDAPYLLRLSGTSDEYVVQAALASPTFAPAFEAGLRQWFDPREPFPLMRLGKGAFSEFWTQMTRNCPASSLQTQRMIIRTHAPD